MVNVREEDRLSQTVAAIRENRERQAEQARILQQLKEDEARQLAEFRRLVSTIDAEAVVTDRPRRAVSRSSTDPVHKVEVLKVVRDNPGIGPSAIWEVVKDRVVTSAQGKNARKTVVNINLGELKKAGLVSNPRIGAYYITDEGRTFLASTGEE